MNMRKLIGSVLVACGLTMVAQAVAFDLTLNNNDRTFDGLKATTYNGWVENGTGQPIGYITCKVGRPDKAALHKITASVTLLGQKAKLKFTGKLPKNMETPLDEIEGVLISKIGARLDLLYITQLELRAQLTLGSATYLVKGVRDFAADKYDTRKSLLQQYQGNYVFAPQVIVDLNNPQDGKFYGSIGLTVKVNGKGVAKVTGLLPDGNKFTVSTRLLLDDNGAHLPVFGQLYGRLGGFGGYIFKMDDFTSDTGSTGFWDGTGAKTARGGDVWYARYNGDLVGGKVSLSSMPSAGLHTNQTFMIVNAGGLVALNAQYTDFFGLTINEELLPSPLEMSFAGKKFTPAANQCKFKLSYVQKTGALKGSCQIMTTSSQRFNAKINGVWINGRGWINATTKDKGCVGMLVE